jgi:hypothetical protein
MPLTIEQIQSHYQAENVADREPATAVFLMLTLRRPARREGKAGGGAWTLLSELRVG